MLGSTTICDSVQNEVEPRGIQDGTMVVDNLRQSTTKLTKCYQLTKDTQE